MSHKSTDQMLLMAQMMADVDGTDLRSKIDSYLPFIFIIVAGLLVSAIAMYSASLWERHVGSAIAETNKRSYYNEAIRNLTTLKQNTNAAIGFFEASNYVDEMEFDSFSGRLLDGQNPSTSLSVLHYRGHNYSEPTQSSGKPLYPYLLSRNWLEKIKKDDGGMYSNIRGPEGQQLVVHAVPLLDSKKDSHPVVLSAFAVDQLIADIPNQQQLYLSITDSLGNTVTQGADLLHGDSNLLIQDFEVEGLKITMGLSKDVINLESSAYIKWILAAFSLVFTVSLCIQFVFARRSIRNLASLAVERANELTSINSDLADEIIHRVEFQAELVQKNQEIHTINEQLEEVQNQLIQQEKLASLGQLAAGVAHEINNPVGFINSNLTMLRKYADRAMGLISTMDTCIAEVAGESVQRDIAEQKKAFKYKSLQNNMTAVIDESMEGVNRVKQIVQDLKDFSRIDEAEWQSADIHAGIDSTLNIVWNEVKYKAQVHRDYGELPDIECVPSQINQVIMNLLVNAAHAMESSGNIYVRTSAQQDTVTIVVEDDGCGIPEEVISKIFDPFFTTKEVGMGTGLGLSLSYGIVKKHNGELSVQSEPGKGTTFTIVLPINHKRPNTEAA